MQPDNSSNPGNSPNEGGGPASRIVEINKMLFTLQTRFLQYDVEKSQYLLEKSELETKVNFLEGQLKSYISVNLELVQRIKLLEAALLSQRNVKRVVNESTLPDKVQPDVRELPPTISAQPFVCSLSNDIQKGRHLLQQYLSEMDSVDSHIANGYAFNSGFAKRISAAGSNGLGAANISTTNNNKVEESKNNEGRSKTFDENRLLNTLKESFSKGRMARKLERYMPNAENQQPLGGSDILLDSKSDLLDDELSQIDMLLTADDQSPPPPQTQQTQQKEQKEQKETSKARQSKLVDDENEDYARSSTVIKKKDAGHAKAKKASTRKTTILGMYDSDETQSFNKTWLTSNLFYGHLDTIYDVDLHASSKRIVSGGEDGLVCVFDFDKTTTLEVYPRQILRNHTCAVTNCKYIYNNVHSINIENSYVVSSDMRGNIHLFEHCLEKSDIDDILRINDGLMYSGTSEYKLRYSDINSEADRCISHLTQMCCKDKNMLIRLYSSGKMDLIDNIFEVAGGEALNVVSSADVFGGRQGPREQARKCAVMNRFDAGEDRPVYVLSTEGTVYEYDVQRNQASRIISKEGLVDVSCSDDHTGMMVGGLANGDIALWDMRTSKSTPVKEFTGHSTKITSVAFIGNSYNLISADKTGAINIWDLSYYSCKKSFNSHKVKRDDSVTTIATSPLHNDYFVTGGADELVRLYI